MKETKVRSEMKKTDKKLVLWLVITLCICLVLLVVVAGFSVRTDKKTGNTEQYTEEENRVGEKEDGEADKKEEAEGETDPEEDEDKEEYHISLKKLPEKAGNYPVPEKKLEKKLREWFDENGYYTAVGGVFSDTGFVETTDVDGEEKYTAELTLEFDPEMGQPDGEVKISVDVFPEEDLLTVHK